MRTIRRLVSASPETSRDEEKSRLGLSKRWAADERASQEGRAHCRTRKVGVMWFGETRWDVNVQIPLGLS